MHRGGRCTVSFRLPPRSLPATPHMHGQTLACMQRRNAVEHRGNPILFSRARVLLHLAQRVAPHASCTHNPQLVPVGETWLSAVQ